MREEPGAVLNADGGGEWGEESRRLGFLRRVELFRGLDREALIAVAMSLQPQTVVEGAIVCRENDRVDDFYLIESGTLVMTVDVGGQFAELARLGAGQFFGETALLGLGVHGAAVRAVTAARLWSLSGADFQELMNRVSALGPPVEAATAAFEAGLRQRLFEVESRNLAALAEGQTQIRIGRDPDNDLVFESRLVSRHHAVLERVPEGFRLRDLRSTHGTYVNGDRIQSVLLPNGSEVQIADESFTFDSLALRRTVEPRGMRVDVSGVGREVAGGKQLLHDISLSILPGDLVAIVGGSGAGKTTLMDAIAGVHPATSGKVLYNGRDYYRQLTRYRQSLGYVPQDDIIHKDLEVRRTLWFAGKLRLPPDTSNDELNGILDQVLHSLSLDAHAGSRVAALSGGQRKRASIGVELLTEPRIFFLDEPTSGLDPATDSQMMRLMRRLADAGSTVILTTHATKNVQVCDKVVFMARGGYLAFCGTPLRALRYFEVEAFDEIYERLENESSPELWAARFRDSEDYAHVMADRLVSDESKEPQTAAKEAGPSSHLVRQWGILSRRNLEILIKNPANLIPLFATPLFITLLLILLYHAGDFDITAANPQSPAQILFFMAFGGFFFGMTYGLQQICTEFPIFFRERRVNLAIIPYLLSKLIVLLPILWTVLTVVVGLMWLTERMPDASLDVYARVLITLYLTGLTGLAAGLATSAFAKTSQQASIMLPALIMPQVLFGGLLQPVPSMSAIPKLLSAVMALRWSFNALGQIMNLNDILARSTSPQGRPLLQQFGDTFSGGPAGSWLVLVLMTVVFFALASVTLQRKSSDR